MKIKLVTFLCTIALVSFSVAEYNVPNSYHVNTNDIRSLGVEVSYDSYSNWASSINGTGNFLITYPRTNAQVVLIVNWAYKMGKNVRIQGYRHSYPPITVSEEDRPSQIILIDMTRYMKNLRMGNIRSKDSTQLTTVVTQPGASMEELLTFAENNGYGIVMAPIVGGDATVGGVLAIGGHGAGIPAIYEKLTSPGFTFGSVSNSIAELKAIVWDSNRKEYVLKTFTRSDPDIAAFFVHVGRAVITEVSILVGENYNMRCLSLADVPGSELFAHPENTSASLTFKYFLDTAGRVDVIWYPFTESPWLKIWQVLDEKPKSSRLVTSPYNYQFESTFDNPQTPGTVFGPQSYERLVRGLTRDNVWDIWGPSKNTILHYNETASPKVYSGFVVLTNRENAQLVLHDMVEFYLNLLNKYGARGIYPIDQYIKLRCTGLDDPRETLIKGAVAPLISATGSLSDRPEFDVGCWMNTLTTTDRPYSDAFMREIEQWAYQRYNGVDSIVRPEWSKNWGHSNNAPFSDPKFLRETIPNVYGTEEWNRAINILDKYDPHRVISNKFLRELMVPYGISGGNQQAKGNRGGGEDFGWGLSEYLNTLFSNPYKID